MQRALITLLAIGTAPVAAAHTLDSGSGVMAALVHELFGAHHLPITLLLVVLGIALLRLLRGKVF